MIGLANALLRTRLHAEISLGFSELPMKSKPEFCWFVFNNISTAARTSGADMGPLCLIHWILKRIQQPAWRYASIFKNPKMNHSTTLLDA